MADPDEVTGMVAAGTRSVPGGARMAEELAALRLTLSPAEQEDLRELGTDTAAALEESLMAWRPGERDLDIQGRVAELLESRGADAPVLIVGGDDRVRRFRHPMAVGAPVRELAMAVVVARLLARVETLQIPTPASRPTSAATSSRSRAPTNSSRRLVVVAAK